MNKINILFLGGLIAVGMVACDDKLPVATPQANPQGPVLETIDGASAALTSQQVDLAVDIPEGEEYINIYTVNAGTSGLPVEDIYGELEISNTPDFTQSVILPAYDGIVGTVSTADLNEAHVQLFGNSPYAKTVYYRVLMYATVNGSDYRLGSLDSYGDQGTYQETYDPGYTISETLYIIGVKGWEPKDCVEMSHEEGVSAYDDPVFTYEVASEEAVYWKIVPADVYAQVDQPGFDPNADFWPNIYSVNPNADNPFSGTIEIKDGASGELQAGTWTISVNLQDLTYNVVGVPAGMPDWIGTPNTSQDWSISTSMRLMPYDDNYNGFAYFGGEWGGKLGYSIDEQEIWIGQAEGTTPEEVTGDDGALAYYQVQLVENGGGNIFEGKDAQTYYISYSFPSKVAKFYPIESCGLIGGFNDWSEQQPMTAVADSNNLKWSITYTFDGDTEFKFRFNNTWDVNLGGELTDLQFNGDNISVKAGTYEISLDLSAVPYTATITAK